MHKLMLTLLLLAAASVQAQPDPEREVRAVFESFLSRLTNQDAAVADLFREDVQFWGTSTRTLATDISGVSSYFSSLDRQNAGQNVARAVDYSVNMVSAELALLAGIWSVELKAAERTVSFRTSMALALRDGRWEIVQFHNSAMP